jgi:hypothetical protein
MSLGGADGPTEGEQKGMSQYGFAGGTHMGSVEVAIYGVEDGTTTGAVNGALGNTGVAAAGVADGATIRAIDGSLGDIAVAIGSTILGSIDGSWTKSDIEGGRGHNVIQRQMHTLT